MRIAIDTNVFISYLLAPGSGSAPSVIVRAVLAGIHELVIPEEIIEEIRGKTSAKPDLVDRIPQAQVDDLLAILVDMATIVRSNVEIPVNPARDPGDDFLLKSAVLTQVEAIVSGDSDVLAIAKAVAPVWIASPAEFVRYIGDAH